MFHGLKRETGCSCGCRKRIPAGEDTAVMVDMDSYPRKKYLPGHEPREQATVAEHPSPQPPAPTAPPPAAPQPTTEPSPAPAPKPSEPKTRNAPEGPVGTASLADNRPWAIVQVTVSVGPYESVKVGMADFSGEGEDLAALRFRIAGEVAQELERQVLALRCLHNSHGPNTIKGAATAPSTLSPAPAGAPPARSCSYNKATPEMVRRIDLELSDLSEQRRGKKVKLMNHWLKDYGYASPDQATADTLTELLAEFERVNAAHS
jgi:hypothetical protein